MKLHPTQERLLRLLAKNITNPLTIRELQDELDLSTPSLVHHHIQQLEKRGYLRRNPNNPQDYQVLTPDAPEQLIAYINMYGMAQCGPGGTILSGDPEDRIPLCTKLLGFKSEEAFMVRARGNSMAPKINEGDLVIAKKSNDAKNGDIVVCTNEGKALIKKLQKVEDKVILISLNPAYDPFVAGQDDFRVEGIVKGILTYKV